MDREEIESIGPENNRESLYFINDATIRVEAAELISQGEIVGINFDGEVYALVGDPYNMETMRSLYDMKERSLDMPMSVMGPLQTVIETVDLNRVPNHLQDIFTNTEAISALLNGNSFIRYPLNEDAENRMPPYLLSRDKRNNAYLQLISIEGNSPSALMQKELIENIKKKYPDMPALLAITSMNRSGMPSIRYPLSDSESEGAIDFALNNNLKLLVHNPKNRPSGSYSIVEVIPHGLRIARNGTGLDQFLKEMEKHGFYTIR